MDRYCRGCRGEGYCWALYPEDAIPAEEAAQIILQGVADKKGIILVPDQPCRWLWHEYCNSSEAAEDFLLKMAHDRRIEWSKRQRI